MKHPAPGFTLVELVVVIVVTGVLAAGLVTFFKPAMENYAAAGRRAALTDMADGAARRMGRDVRLAVPNSIRQPGNQCFELVPTNSGGKFRTAVDTVSTGSISRELDVAVPAATFDVFAPLARPRSGDWLIIGNQNASDLYSGLNRNSITAIAAPPASDQAGVVIATDRITLSAAATAPLGYAGNNYVTVDAAQGPVTYVCDNTGVDAQGTGTGTLYRLSGYGFNQKLAACPAIAPGTAGLAVLATRVSSCTFDFDPSVGAIQGSGYMRIALRLQQANEAVNLLYGAHADNLP